MLVFSKVVQMGQWVEYFVDSFAELPFIESIFLTHQQVSTIKNFQFGNTGVNLVLTYNEITTIEPLTFEGN